MRSKKATHHIYVLNATRKRPSLSLLKSALSNMLESESLSPVELTVLLTNKQEVKRLNRQFRKQDEYTDVLSFPAEPQPRQTSRRYLGDIAIAYEIAKEQAEARGVPLSYELACLALHGALHLLGYHHDTEHDQRLMNEKMKSALRSAGCLRNLEWFSFDHI